MLYAASVKITFNKTQRRLDLIIEADTAEQAETKALKQARKMYCPGKKANYAICAMVNETEALATYAAPISPK